MPDDWRSGLGQDPANWLRTCGAPPPADIEGFRQGLREHGYIDGKNIIVEYRWGDGSEPRLREILVDLIRLKVDLIVASAPAAVRAAKEVTTSVAMHLAGGVMWVAPDVPARVAFARVPL